MQNVKLLLGDAKLHNIYMRCSKTNKCYCKTPASEFVSPYTQKMKSSLWLGERSFFFWHTRKGQTIKLNEKYCSWIRQPAFVVLDCTFSATVLALNLTMLYSHFPSFRTAENMPQALAFSLRLQIRRTSILGRVPVPTVPRLGARARDATRFRP